MNKYCIYTCLIGDYDSLIIPRFINTEFDYICYTDRTQLLLKNKVGPWEIRPLLFSELDDTRNQRWHKILGYQYLADYQASIYMDNNINVISDYIYNITIKSQKPLIIPAHDIRSCIFDEINACSSYHKDSETVLSSVFTYLSESGMPKNYGLTENNLICRVHGIQEIDKIMYEWWSLLTMYSKRDQLSLCYVLWKHHILPKDIEIPNIRLDLDNFRVYPHINGFTPFSFLRASLVNYYTPYQPIHTCWKMCVNLPNRVIHFMIRNLRNIHILRIKNS